MICSISGEPTLSPVISPASGAIFDRALITTYLSTNPHDPITQTPLTVDELIAVRPASVVRPKTATSASIPALLAQFQSEWDAVALETFQLRQELQRARQELSTALYQHDAAVRVVARLMKERDEARASLAELTVSLGVNNDQQQQHPPILPSKSAQLPAATLELLTETHTQLSTTRRKRKMVESWSTIDQIASLQRSTVTHFAELNNITLSSRYRDQILVSNGLVAIHYQSHAGDDSSSVVSLSVLNTYTPVESEDRILSLLLTESGAWVGTKSGLMINMAKPSVFSQTLSGPVVDILCHPVKSLLISISSNSFQVHDIVHNSTLATVVNNDDEFVSAAVHPDGYLLAIITKSNHSIVIYNLPTLEVAATFERPLLSDALSSTSSSSPVLEFSENGYWLASTAGANLSPCIWDLRKGVIVHTFDDNKLSPGADIRALSFDYSGLYLWVNSDKFGVVYGYDKKAKSWVKPLEVQLDDDNSVKGYWGDEARSLLVVGQNGVSVYR